MWGLEKEFLMVIFSMGCFPSLTFFYADFGKEFPCRTFWERSILRLPLSKLCAVPLALQNRALFEGRKGRKGAEKGRKRGGQQREQKGKQGRAKTGQKLKGFQEGWPNHAPKIPRKSNHMGHSAILSLPEACW